MMVTVMATQIAEAVAKDETPEAGGCDISAGLYGPHLSQWIRETATLLAEQRAAVPTKATEADEFEIRADGCRVRKDRWQIGMRRIVALLWGNRHEFEVDDVVEAVQKLIPEPFNLGDDEHLVRVVLGANHTAESTAEPVVPKGTQGPSESSPQKAG